MESDTLTVAMNAVKKFDQLQRFHGQTRLFPDFADHACFQRLAKFQHAARKGPMAFQRLASATHQQHAALIDHHRAHSDQRCLGILALHLPSIRIPALSTIEVLAPFSANACSSGAA